MWEMSNMARVESSGIVTLLPAMFSRAKPDDLSWRQWTIQADVSASFFTDVKKGIDPSIGRVERAVNAIGLTLVDFFEGRLPADVVSSNDEALVHALRVAIQDMPRGSADNRAQYLAEYLSTALGLPQEQLATLASRRHSA
jgi:hypothetical protein